MKKVLLISVLIISIIFTIAYAKEETPIRVQLDGNYLDFKDEQGNTVNPPRN